MKILQWNMLFNKTAPIQNKEPLVDEVDLKSARSYIFVKDPQRQIIQQQLIAANQEIALEKSEKHEIATELLQAKQEIAFVKEEKEKMENELVISQDDLAKAESTIQDHVEGLEEIMFMTSHKVRQPIANILGLANILDHFIKSPATIKKMVEYIKQSTLTLDGFTKELSLLVDRLKKKKQK